MNTLPALHLAVLGNFQLSHDGRPLTLSHKAQALLAYLAITGQTHSREWLATLLWPDSEGEQALSNLRKILSELRPVVGDYLESSRQFVQLHPLPAGAFDLQQFRAWFQEVAHLEDHWPVKQKLFEQAAGLYHAPLLDHFVEPNQDGEEFVAWLTIERERLHRQICQIERALAEQSFTQGEWLKTEKYIGRWLALEPLQEGAYRLLINLYLQRGEVEKAAGCYQNCVQVLEKELGVLPTIQTQQLGDVVQKKQILKPLLPFSDPQKQVLMGREAEINQVLELLHRPGVCLITLTGLPGIGKTAVAQAVKAQLAGGVWVSAGSSAYQRLVQQQLPPAGKWVLFLDGFNHPTPAEADWLYQLLVHNPAGQLVLTSHGRLNWQLEQVVALQGLVCPTTPAELASSPAGQLLLGGHPVTQDASHYVKLCELVEGHPALLKLLNHHLAHHTPADLLARWPAALFTSPQGVWPHWAEMAGVVWQKISPAEKQQLRQWATTHQPPTDELLLLNWVDQSLVTVTPAGGYHLPHPIQQLALSTL